jgi:glucose uptake protein
VIPSTQQAALLLLLPAFLGLGLWPSTYRPNEAGSRFEFFSLDFAWGALLFAVAAAYTLGTFGSQLGFSDRMLVAGYTKQGWEVAGGAFFNVGNMLVLAAASMIGLAAAFTISISVAVIVGVLLDLHSLNVWMAIGGIVLLAAAVYLLQKASMAQAPPAVRETERDPRFRKKSPRRVIRRGTLIAMLSGIPLGLVYNVVSSATEGDFGVGPYAGLLLFSVGILISTLALNIFFLNIGITGAPASYNRYWRSKNTRHLRSFLGGIIWSVGALAIFLAIYLVPEIGLNQGLTFAAAVASVLLVIFLGVVFRKEFRSGSAQARSSLGLGIGLFVAGVAVVALAMPRT